MGECSHIGWCDDTFNGWWGCSRVSRACRFCYAADESTRFDGGISLWRKNGPRRIMVDRTWNNPLRWNRAAQAAGIPRRVFSGSMCDVFEDHPLLQPLRTRLFNLAEVTPWLIWMYLTKRPENIAGMVPWGSSGWPPNVWVGASVESDRYAWERVTPLLDLTGPVKRFVSCEPLVGPLSLRAIVTPEGSLVDALGGDVTSAPGGKVVRAYTPARLDWVIVGGESRRRRADRIARMDPAWLAALAAEAAATGTPFFLKQTGELLAEEWGCTGNGTDRAEWPIAYDQEHPRLPIPAG